MPAVREIDVRKQTQLSFARVFRLVLAGISHRFFRSFLTMAVILLAVAFFMAMLSESVFLRSTARGVSGEIDRTRDATRRLGLYFKAPTTTLLLGRTLAAVAHDEPALAEYAAVSGTPADDLRRLALDAERESVYLDFMRGLKVGPRLILFQKRTDRDAFRHILPLEPWREFLGLLHGLPAVRLPEPDPDVALRVMAAYAASAPAVVDHNLGNLPGQPATVAFRDFLEGFPAYMERLQAFDRTWRDALARVADASRAVSGVDELGLVTHLARADDAHAEAWRKTINEAGFALDADQFAAMRAYLKVADLRNRLRRDLGTRNLRLRWQLAFPDKRFTIDEKLAMLARPDAVALTEPYPAKELEEASRFFADPDRLRPLYAQLDRPAAVKPGAEPDPDTLSPRDELALGLQKIDGRFAEPDALAPAALEAWLNEADPEAVQLFAETTLAAFPNLAAAERREMQRVVTLTERVARLRTDLTGNPEVLANWAARPGADGDDSLPAKFAFLATPNAGQLWPRHTAAELAAVADLSARESRLNDLEAHLTKKLDGPIGGERGILTGRQLFLLLISFCVCMVGIANAMLMAITERFREIATMKCLGATDGFILLQFMMEAGSQGLVGGVLGMIAGLVLSLVKNGWMFGEYLWRYFPALDLLACSVVCVVVGIVLAVFASLYPSWAASRMAPMEAMRVE